MLRILIFLLLWAPMGQADGEKAGEFDYYVMALSWSPNWCRLEGQQKGSRQCQDGANYGWVLHGLWPQYEQGWPAHCPTVKRPPSRSMTSSMADIMGTSGLAWHQWKKHGTCTGLSAQDYYDISRKAFEAVKKPEVFSKLQEPVKLPALVVEEAFLKDNPDFSSDMVTITCIAGHIQEARFCLSKDLHPTRCLGQAAQDCHMKDALFESIK